MESAGTRTTSRFTGLAAILSTFLLATACTGEQASGQPERMLDTASYRAFQNLAYYETVAPDPERIRPWSGNPLYWQYKGEPVLLLGASDEDNLFNHPRIWPFGLASHLDLIAANGGNYVRNTMSSRDHGNLWPFGLAESGRYDLDIWNSDYWTRFEEFLRMTYERDIIVQLEVWDRWDYALGPWDRNPFNPVNNVNYGSEESRLPKEVHSHPGKNENPFFKTPPELEDNPLVRGYQEALVDRILSISLQYPNVLYCVSNETSESPAWSDYWAYFILKRAKEEGIRVYVTEMWNAWDLSDPSHDATFKRPDLYAYVDISQNNHQTGQAHWDNAQRARTQIVANGPRPMNSVKIYSGTSYGGGFEEGARKLWRNIFGGAAASRFHRTADPFDPAGIGLTALAQSQMRSMRMFADKMNVFAGEPANDLIIDRRDDEAFAMAAAPREYAVYFPDGGAVTIDLSSASGSLSLRWLDIHNSEWRDGLPRDGGGKVRLNPPGTGPWVALLESSLKPGRRGPP